MKYHLIFISLFFIVGCRPSDPVSEDFSTPQIEYPTIIEKMFHAHGGLDVWNEKSGLTYHISRGERKEIHTIDLKSRKVLINGDGYDIGFNGQQAWISPDKSNWPDARPRFYHNLIFYFHSLVFLVADPGIIFEEKGPIEMDGVDMVKVSVTYQNNVGDSPEDEYVLYINASTYQLEYIQYTVTYFTKEQSKQYSGLRYTKWTKVDGLLIPEEFKGYKVDGDQLTEERYTASFTDIHFSLQNPESQIFEIPEISIIDTLK